MNNDNFEQQFAKNVQQQVSVAPPTSSVTNQSSTSSTPSALPWVIVAILSAVVLLQVVVLIIVLINFIPESFGESTTETDETSVVSSDSNYVYDDEERLVAFNAVCTNEDNGDNFTFSVDQKYTSPNGSGTYSIVRDSVIVLDDDKDKVFYYDGIILADGLTIYDCEEYSTENTGNTENTED